MDDNRAYLADRLAVELAAAKKAPTPQIAAVHRELADAYAARLDNLAQLPGA